MESKLAKSGEDARLSSCPKAIDAAQLKRPKAQRKLRCAGKTSIAALIGHMFENIPMPWTDEL